MAKKSNEYFETFETLVSFACDAAAYLCDALRDFDPQLLQGKMEGLHSIEHRADDAKHDMMEKLAKEFVTPIEREDIIQLAGEIDDVVDIIEDVLMRIYMYNIQTMRPEALGFTDVIVRCCQALKVAVAEFPNFAKSHTLHQALVDVNTMEEEGDGLYVSAMRSLFTDPSIGATQVVAWSETFDKLEECCDACEHVADAMESVVMKNS